MNYFVIGPVRLVGDSEIIDHMDVEVRDSKVWSVHPYDRTLEILRVDGRGLYLSAGFIDIHVHGGGGFDFMDGTREAFIAAPKAHMQHGITSMLPTTLTASVEELCNVFSVFREVKASPDSSVLPELIGIHMEGPYVAPAMAGAQDPQYIRSPEDGSYRILADAAQGGIRIWTVAPELPGALEMCDELKKEGIYFSFGHTEAQYAHVQKAVDRGYTMATHLFSSMSTIVRENGFRRLGAIESSLLLDRIAVEIIADGMHLPIELLQLIYKNKGPGKMILITDAMRGAGMPDGYYKLGSVHCGQEVLVSGGIARMPDGISFAGSVATADRLVKVMTHHAGIPLVEAIRMITVNPACAIGVDDRKGRVEPGYDADLVLFDDDINVQQVYVRGKKTVDFYK